MSSHIAQHLPFFSMRRLREMAETSADDKDDMKDEIIEVFLVLNGEVTVAGKESCILLDNNNLYCANGNKYYKASIKKGTEGFVIRFNKALLFGGAGEFNCSYFSAFLSLVLTGEVVQVDAPFLSMGKRLCEMMLQEFEHENDFKLQILNGFLNIFLFHLMRKLDAVVCNTSN